jgi:hypothetical protein
MIPWRAGNFCLSPHNLDSRGGPRPRILCFLAPVSHAQSVGPVPVIPGSIWRPAVAAGPARSGGTAKAKLGPIKAGTTCWIRETKAPLAPVPPRCPFVPAVSSVGRAHLPCRRGPSALAVQLLHRSPDVLEPCLAEDITHDFDVVAVHGLCAVFVQQALDVFLIVAIHPAPAASLPHRVCRACRPGRRAGRRPGVGDAECAPHRFTSRAGHVGRFPTAH